MIDLQDITLRVGAKTLLENASAHIAEGWKVGLVGANGCGKSTLFRALRGETEVSAGSVSFPAAAKVAAVDQEIADPNAPILPFVLSRDEELCRLTARLEQAAPEEMAEIHERLRLIGAASAEARAASILHGLGFSQEDLTRPLREFSGGWRMRVALAAALFQPSDILLLDEPTNHLDLESSIWLQLHLAAYRGTLLLISHDSSLLNELCDHIVHFEAGRLMSYTGNYDTFQKTRAAQREMLSRQTARQEKQRAHLQSFVDRFRYKASKAKQAQSRLKMLEKLEALPPLAEESATAFSFPEPLALPPPLLTLIDAAAGYDGRTVLQNLNLQVNGSDRIALLGANGNGKSTLAKLLCARLPLLAGERRASGKLKIGYFAQHQSEELPADQTPAQFMAARMPQKSEPQQRAHLARFGLAREKAETTIARLSGGEKARLLFAAMTAEAPGLLILDEPTNHLDIDGRRALTEALNRYDGAVILITHDLNLIRLTADILWLVKDGRCQPYDGDLADYRALLLQTPVNPSAAGKKDGRQQRQELLARRNETNALKTRVSRGEKQIDDLNRRRQELISSFAQNLPAPELIARQKELAALETELTAAEENWLADCARLEELTSF